MSARQKKTNPAQIRRAIDLLRDGAPMPEVAKVFGPRPSDKLNLGEIILLRPFVRTRPTVEQFAAEVEKRFGLCYSPERARAVLSDLVDRELKDLDPEAVAFLTEQDDGDRLLIRGKGGAI